jgi:hypothetical protein
MSQWKYLQKIFSLAFSQTLQAFGLTTVTLFLGAASLGLGVFFHWYIRGWPEASEEVAIFIMYSVAPTLLLIVGVFMWNFFWYSPYTLNAQLSEKLARTSDITLSQLRGHGDNTQAIWTSSDSWLALIRDLILVNRDERDEVVSLKLCWPLNNDMLFFSPQTALPPALPPNIGHVSLLTGVENIPARRSVPGSLLFKIPRSTVPHFSPPFLIIMVTSQLTGIERAFNSLTFTEVMKPYPRTLEELNRQLASFKQ